MTSTELCQSAGLTPRELKSWLDTGLLEPQTVSIPGGGCRYDFTAGQAEHARLIKALHRKGVALSRLARTSLAFDAEQRFVIFDGQELRACPDAVKAIAVAVRARRWCSVIELAAIRAYAAE